MSRKRKGVLERVLPSHIGVYMNLYQVTVAGFSVWVICPTIADAMVRGACKLHRKAAFTLERYSGFNILINRRQSDLESRYAKSQYKEVEDMCAALGRIVELSDPLPPPTHLCSTCNKSVQVIKGYQGKVFCLTCYNSRLE